MFIPLFISGFILGLLLGMLLDYGMPLGGSTMTRGSGIVIGWSSNSKSCSGRSIRRKSNVRRGWLRLR